MKSMQVHQPNWPAPTNIQAYYTTGQIDQHAYASICANLATHTQQDLATALRNRQQLAHRLNMPNEPMWLEQTHSSNVHHAHKQQTRINADACFSRTSGLICTVLTADCLPILITNTTGTEVAAVHAGWRGLAQNIIANTVALSTSQPSKLMAWIGPSIGRTVYEIDRNTRNILIENGGATQQCFQISKSNHYLADLASIAKQQLHLLGIKNVYLSKLCTYTDERFFSFRRDQSPGRQACGIWIKTDAEINNANNKTNNKIMHT